MNVLIVFHSSRGQTEHVALAVGVGAIQARASIRLRRLPPGPAVDLEAMTAQQRGNFERMARDYVAPRQADPLWADVVILATSLDGARDVAAYVEQLPALGTVAGKVAAPLTSGDSPDVLRSIYAAAANAGLIVVPSQTRLDSTDARQAYGRQAVEIARAVKGAGPR